MLITNEQLRRVRSVNSTQFPNLQTSCRHRCNRHVLPNPPSSFDLYGGKLCVLHEDTFSGRRSRSPDLYSFCNTSGARLHPKSQHGKCRVEMAGAARKHLTMVIQCGQESIPRCVQVLWFHHRGRQVGMLHASRSGLPSNLGVEVL